MARGVGAKLAIIAIPSAARREMMAIMEACKGAGLECQIVPSLPELRSGRAKLSQVREVDIEDLLGRGAVELDLSAARGRLAGKVVMVTGGAGSIGSELARQAAALGPAKLVLVEQAESPLYFVEIELRGAHPAIEIAVVIADVTDRNRMAEVFAAHVGRAERVLVTGPSKRDPAQLIGRTDGFKTVILPAGVGGIGQFVDVTIERATMATLFARAV